MNKDKESKSKNSTPRNEQDDNSGQQLKCLNQFEGTESWSTAESSVGSSARKRPSSWDDSDDELQNTTINYFNHNGLIYSRGSQKQEKSVTAEINDIKTQYFKNLDAAEDLSEPRNFSFEAKTCNNIEDKGGTTSKLDESDRRQSPARIRRRTKSSSSSSAVLEPTVECSSFEYKENFQILTPECYQYKAPRHESYSSKSPSLETSLELDSNYFLDQIFTKLRTKRIGLVSLGKESSLGKGSREGKILDLERCSGSNIELLKSHDLTRTFPSPIHNPDLETYESFESEEPITFIHKTSRKLSQILEVEEAKKSQEGINHSEEERGVQLFEMSPFFWTNPQKPPDDKASSFPTSNDGKKNPLCWTSILSLREKAESSSLKTAQLSPKNTGSLRKLEEKEKPENQTKGKVSESFHNLLPFSDSDNIIFLTEKMGKTQLGPNSKKQEDNNCGSPKDYEEVKYFDGVERETSWEILEMVNVNSESEKLDVGEENHGSRGKNSDSDTRQKNLRQVKIPNSKVEKISQEGTIPNLSEETALSWSEGSTPRRTSRNSLRKSSKREREPDFRLETESSNIAPRRLTGITTEEGTPTHSSRESSFLLNDKYTKTTFGETSRGSSQRSCDNLHPEIVEDQPNFLNIDLEKVCSNSSTSTESNSSSSRTFTQEEIRDSSSRTNSSDQSAKNSHTSEPPKNRSSKKMKNYFSDSSNPNRLRTEGKSQKMSSRRFKSSEAIFGNPGKNTKSLVSNALNIQGKKATENSDRRSTTTAKKKPSNTDEIDLLSENSTNSCRSGVSGGTGIRLAELNDAIESLESTKISRQGKNCPFYDDVTMPGENIICEKINSGRSEKAGRKWRNDESFERNEGMKKGLCERRSEETTGGEDFQSCRKNGGTVRNNFISEQFSEDVVTVEEPEKYLGEKSSLSSSSARSIIKELTISIEDTFDSLEKIEIVSDKSDREKERAKTEGNQESERSRRTRKLSSETLSITCEKLEEKTSKPKLFSEQTNNRTAISSLSSEVTEKHTLSCISGLGSSICTRTEGSQTLNEILKSSNSKTSFQKSLEHETSKESMALKGEMWNGLLDAFEGTQKSDRSSDSKFPGFPSLNQKGFTEHDREETQEFFLYEPDELNESDDIFTLSRRLIEAEEKSCLRSRKDRELNGGKSENLVQESINSPLEHSEGNSRILKSNEEKTVHEHDSKIRNFGIGEFGDGNCWHDGKPDISEPEKPRHHGDGKQERRNNWETLVLRLDYNKKEKEMKSRIQTWMELEDKTPRPSPLKNKSLSGRENDADLKPNFISDNLNYSKSENNLSKMWSQKKANESENFKTSTNTSPMKGSTKRKSEKNSVSNRRTENCSEQSLDERREYHVGRSYSSDESQLIYGENPGENFERLNIVTCEMENRKQEKDSRNLNIFLAGREKKEKSLVKDKNWLIMKNREGKQWKQQKEKIRKLKKKLKKCEKHNSSKEPFYIDENATGRMPAFIPALKFGDTGCLQNFYKRLFSICCLTSNSSTATSV